MWCLDTGTCRDMKRAPAFLALRWTMRNRIRGGSFTLRGKTFLLEKNDNGVNTLHGGRDFTNQRLWKVEKEEAQSITFLLHSPDGDQGFPGTVDIRVTYELTDDDVLRIHYHGMPDQDTILNFTNHSYFNLDGHGAGNVLEQKYGLMQMHIPGRTGSLSLPERSYRWKGRLWISGPGS